MLIWVAVRPGTSYRITGVPVAPTTCWKWWSTPACPGLL